MYAAWQYMRHLPSVRQAASLQQHVLGTRYSLLQSKKSSSICISLSVGWLQDFSAHVRHLSKPCGSMPKLKVYTAQALAETWLVMGW